MLDHPRRLVLSALATWSAFVAGWLIVGLCSASTALPASLAAVVLILLGLRMRPPQPVVERITTMLALLPGMAVATWLTLWGPLRPLASAPSIVMAVGATAAALALGAAAGRVLPRRCPRLLELMGSRRVLAMALACSLVPLVVATIHLGRPSPDDYWRTLLRHQGVAPAGGVGREECMATTPIEHACKYLVDGQCVVLPLLLGGGYWWDPFTCPATEIFREATPRQRLILQNYARPNDAYVIAPASRQNVSPSSSPLTALAVGDSERVPLPWLGLGMAGILAAVFLGVRRSPGENLDGRAMFVLLASMTPAVVCVASGVGR